MTPGSLAKHPGLRHQHRIVSIPASAPAALRRALPGWLALNAILALGVAHGFVRAASASSTDAAAYAYLAFAAAILATAGALGGALALATFLPGGRVLARVAAPVVATALLAFLWVDRAAFATYRFHVGGLAWSALWLPGGLAELGVWPASTPGFVAAVGAVALVQNLVLRWLEGRAARGRWPAGGWRWLLGVAIAAVAMERAAYLAAEHLGRRDVVRMAQAVPFYSVLMANDLPRLWHARFGTQPAPGSNQSATASLRFRPDAPRWNVLWIVLDSWRADAMTPALTPVVAALGRRSTVFRAHTSGGDATRYGLVSMLYGLPASTWSRLEMERRSPPLLAALRDRGWQLALFTSLEMPDVTAVVFGDVQPAARAVAAPARSGLKDRATIAALEEFLATRPPDPPYFAFVHLLSTHWNYDPSCRLPREGRSPRARYERAIRCADRLVARALRRVSLADTVVVVTSDHGEAFGEHGVVGHAAGFTLPQLRVPLVLHVPRRPPAVVHHPTTHHDLAATLLEVLGAELPTPAAGIGRSLFDGTPAPVVFACNMNECAIHDATGSVRFGVGTRYPRQLEIRDAGGTRVAGNGEERQRRFAQVLELLALQRAALP